MEDGGDSKTPIKFNEIKENSPGEESAKHSDSTLSSDGVDSDDPSPDHHSDSSSDVIRLITSTRNLLRASLTSSTEDHPSKTEPNELNPEVDIPSPMDMDTECSPVVYVTEDVMESKFDDMSSSCQPTTSSKECIDPSQVFRDDPPQSEDLPSSELQPDVQKPTMTSLPLEQLNTPRRQTEHSKISSTTGDYQVSSRVCEKESVAALPDFLPYSQRTHGSVKRGKIGISFFRQKPTPSAQYKAVQMKELKRMIRAGKPSYEQIHSWRNSFETLLNDRFGLALFKDFLSTEFSDENIEFWIACQEYKKITNPKKLAVRAQQIFDQFVAVQAVREVNLDSKTRLETEAEIANPTVHTLDNAQKRIQALMEKDSYRRFLRSEVYLTLYSEAREVAKAVAASALAASLQEASEELEGAVLNLITSSSSTSHFSFLSNLGSNFNASTGTGLHLPGVAAAAASAEAGMNSVQDLQLLGLSTSRHMRNSRKSSAADNSAKRFPKTESDSHSDHPNASTSDQAR
ncbi:hypothetical protein CRM22_011103 [Opisthorchis felineus]|uniref:RGS domain-containing protein n=1 Tax=Opisthorchis felineus TaxID=147828 RepID=A0A4S2KFK8_OPIFE|nr:hypothetical protein CRM22_011103 [Opisthorchis felineus]